ncbi:hypothetical protein RND71_020111 [Anisodus tanguticus]|uniref:Uncharacterized protein n=1 Tax=Anisodus tanguticus TaxID=243964 RepID=A0AAE1S1I7_9SOLA|nr:hypothetical protein RND71_020111 [Anisodus tanguticus]
MNTKLELQNKEGWTDSKQGEGQGQEKSGQTSTGTQQSGHISRSNCHELEFGTQQSQQSGFKTQIGTQQSTAYGPDIGDDEDPTLRPKVIFEVDTLLVMRKTRMRPLIDSKRIQFTRYVNRVSTPTNLPYSSTKMTWRGSEAVTSIQLQDEVRKKCIKMKARKARRTSP